MSESRRQLCTTTVLTFLALAAHTPAQSPPPPAEPPSQPTPEVLAPMIPSKAEIMGGAISPLAGTIFCLSRCDFCHFGSPFEMSCPADWLADGDCDCACQFADNSDCSSNCSCPSACVWCWCNTTAQGACPTFWNGDGECDCACQFADIDCPTTPTGACCFSNVSCSVVTSASCSSSGGVYRGNGVACALRPAAPR